MPADGTKPAFANRPAGGATGPAFPSDGSDLVFARIAQMIRTAVPLQSVTVRAWDDPTVDQSPPGSDGPPWVRLTPTPGMAEPWASDPGAGGVVHRMPFDVAIETSTPGTDIRQSQSLWGAILSAIFPGPSLDLTLVALGVSTINVKKAGWGAPPPTKEGATAVERCEGVGMLEVVMFFVTPE